MTQMEANGDFNLLGEENVNPTGHDDHNQTRSDDHNQTGIDAVNQTGNDDQHHTRNDDQHHTRNDDQHHIGDDDHNQTGYDDQNQSENEFDEDNESCFYKADLKNNRYRTPEELKHERALIEEIVENAIDTGDLVKLRLRTRYARFIKTCLTYFNLTIVRTIFFMLLS